VPQEFLQQKPSAPSRVLQFSDPVFHVGAPVAVAVFPLALPTHHESPRDARAMQVQMKLPGREVFAQRGPLLDPLGRPFDPLGEAGDYDVGQMALFQKAQQLVVKEAGIGPQQADLPALSPQRESFFEKLLRATGDFAVPAAESAVEDTVRFAEHGHQRMMAGAATFAPVVSFQRPFLLAAAFEHGRIQIQRVAVCTQRQARYLPFRERFVETLHLADGELSKQVAHGVVARKPLHPQQRTQSPIPLQPRQMREAPGPQAAQ